MILSSDEIEVLEYLKAFNGEFVSMGEVCRSAGGRHKFRDSPNWARGIMPRLVDERLIEVNERGHYRYIATTTDGSHKAVPEAGAAEDYFAPQDAPKHPQIVGDDYFSPMEPLPPGNVKKQWVSPQIETILKKAGKKPAKHHRHD
jgi:hypothetical protein